ncbi:hypothetical protein FE391_12960 [Nonomuraea sp. KC401]|uniref:hypothetical protein n=1 Tax=unclassified Nonomuraea TaxID=2593643 RepID=UPI0010FE8216|nr:hypothetical protein [Nonomuraea sp. KC401]NBE91867.1 hypothetical protein [Nonomuraea sp. K271]TLF75509.1 hypothetical protein FE391_12960 [Nonomuraea sp. KC401]
MIVALIVGCEIGFWLLLGLGLACRYLWHLRTLSAALLLAVPLLDVILLAAAVIDMRGGATGDVRHGLAAAYLAYSIVFGHRTIRWADARFHHRFAGGPTPPRPPAGGMARARYEWTLWLRIVLAYGIACVVLLGLVWLVDDPARTEPLVAFMDDLFKIPLIAILWPVSYTLWPRKVESASS